MESSKYITPRFGLSTCVITALWVAAVLLFKSIVFDTSDAAGGMVVLRFGVVGTLYGVTGWCFWAATVLSGRLMRTSVRVLAVLLASLTMHYLMATGPLLRFVLYFGGLMIAQPAVFFLLNVPQWQIGKSTRKRPGRQFGVGEVIIGTTCVALLLGLAIRYQPQIDAPDYWRVLFGLWII
ncbi:MAG: hypothetical protein MI861_06715, partial [Pirellulales bacterium]|nr:hypothetical protein [Pirellulales bacterium]